MDGNEGQDVQASSAAGDPGAETPRVPITEQIIRIYATEPVAELTMKIFSNRPAAEDAVRSVLTESVSETSLPATATSAAAPVDVGQEPAIAVPEPAPTATSDMVSEDQGEPSSEAGTDTPVGGDISAASGPETVRPEAEGAPQDQSPTAPTDFAADQSASTPTEVTAPEPATAAYADVPSLEMLSGATGQPAVDTPPAQPPEQDAATSTSTESTGWGDMSPPTPDTIAETVRSAAPVEPASADDGGIDAGTGSEFGAGQPDPTNTWDPTATSPAASADNTTPAESAAGTGPDAGPERESSGQSLAERVAQVFGRHPSEGLPDE